MTYLFSFYYLSVFRVLDTVRVVAVIIFTYGSSQVKAPMVIQFVGSSQLNTSVNAVYSIQHVVDECSFNAVIVAVAFHLVIEISLEHSDTSGQMRSREDVVDVRQREPVHSSCHQWYGL